MIFEYPVSHFKEYFKREHQIPGYKKKKKNQLRDTYLFMFYSISTCFYLKHFITVPFCCKLESKKKQVCFVFALLVTWTCCFLSCILAGLYAFFLNQDLRFTCYLEFDL